MDIPIGLLTMAVDSGGTAANLRLTLAQLGVSNPVKISLHGEFIGSAVVSETAEGLAVEIRLDLNNSDKARQVWQSLNTGTSISVTDE